MAKRQLVTYAKLHTAFFVDKIGEIPTTLPSPNKTLPLTMYLSDKGLILDFAKAMRTPATKALIPLPNIAGMVLGDEVEVE